MSTEPTPRSVRVAGAVTTLQAVAGLAFMIALLVRGLAGDLGGVGTLNARETFGEAAYYGVLSGLVLVVGIGLWRGRHWARTPSVLVQLLLLGTAWYALGPSKQLLVGLVLAAPAVAVLWLLFSRSGRQWSFHASAAPDAEADPK